MQNCLSMGTLVINWGQFEEPMPRLPAKLFQGEPERRESLEAKMQLGWEPEE